MFVSSTLFSKSITKVVGLILFSWNNLPPAFFISRMNQGMSIINQREKEAGGKLFHEKRINPTTSVNMEKFLHVIFF